ncbi:MAG: hypothetical protein PF637_09390 [Spirochaetes bacterium]|jgi:hypothetical protein|nr:hypothetical protein [Spirochaetota bacterium]
MKTVMRRAIMHKAIMHKTDTRFAAFTTSIDTCKVWFIGAINTIKPAVTALLLSAIMMPVVEINAQQQAEDDLIPTEQDDLMSILDESPKSSFNLKGFAEVSSDTALSENEYGDHSFFNTGARTKLRPVYSSRRFKAYADIDFFAKAYSHVDQYSFESSEFYIEGGDSLLWKFGKQRFNWGVADMFSVANPLDRIDLSESFARKNDERFTGVYALSLSYITGDYALEAAARPVTEPVMRPAGFYSVGGEVLQTPAGEVTPLYDDGEGERRLKKAALALRGGGTTAGLDWHLLYYSGPQPRSAHSTQLTQSDQGLNLVMAPLFERVNILGFDAAYAVGKLNMRFEGIFVPDMVASEEISDEDRAAAFGSIVNGAESVLMQNGTRRKYFSYSIGFDYNLWGNYGTIYAEWMQSRFLDKKDIEEELQSDILAVRIEDSFFRQALKLSAGTMTRFRGNSLGYAINAEAEYDFKDGLKAGVGTYYFIPNNDTYLQMFEDMSMIYMRMRFFF